MMNTNEKEQYKVIVNGSGGKTTELSAESITFFLDEERVVTIDFNIPNSPKEEFSLLTNTDPSKRRDEYSQFTIKPGACNVLRIGVHNYKYSVSSTKE